MTKKDLINKAINIRNTNKNRVPIADNDRNWLINEIFIYHPEWTKKSVKTIKDVIVDTNIQQYNSRCFFLIYEDNTREDISFRWCITKRPKCTL